MKKTILYLTGVASIVASCGSTPILDINKELSTIDTSYIDRNIAPSEDFFAFANGNWIKNNEIPSSESRWGSFNELEEKNYQKLTEILEGFAKNNPKEKRDKQLGDFYTSFTDLATRNKLGASPIQSDLNKINALNTKDQLPAITAHLHNEGVDVLFDLAVGQDMMSVDDNITYAGESGIGLPNRDYYFDATKEEIRKEYVNYIKDMFVLTGQEEKTALSNAQKVFNFEKKLAGAMLTPAQQRIPELTYNKITKVEFKHLAPKFDIDAYLKAIGSQSFDTLVVSHKPFIKQMNTMIVAEQIETWKAYLSWCVINNAADHLSEAFMNRHFAFYGTSMSGKKEMKKMNERAIDELTNLSIGEMLGHAFVEKHFSEEAKNRVNEMVDNLLTVYAERIGKLTWMSEETKKEALHKLNSFGRKLGFPDKWEDFSSIAIDSKGYYANLIAITKFDRKKNFAELNNKVDKSKWEMPAHMVNAYYHPLINEIAFPAGIMQPPFFDNNAEDAVNYGRIGMVIGHEFTHGFDDMGSKFAADGSFKNWWSDADRHKFEERTQILGNTFSTFCPIKGHCVNPDLTMGENIADLGGLTMAYYAYARTDEFKRNEVRAGFTPAQRFFIAYAQLWKIKYTDAELKKRIATDPHSPGMYRVNGPLKNCPEFFEAFNIPANAKMRNNEKNIANIW